VSACICGADEPCTGYCGKHIRELHGYPCGECGREWEAANPATAKAIGNLAAGRGSLSSYAAAKRTDAARRAALADPETETDRSEDA